MAEFVLSEFVESELAAIWDYIATLNMDTADRFFDAAYANAWHGPTTAVL